jgi:hypothetical protein
MAAVANVSPMFGGRSGQISKGALAALAAALIAGGCSLLLDFSVQGDAGVDGEDLCALFEDNDIIADAIDINNALSLEAAICGDEDDYYKFDILNGQDLILTMRMKDEDQVAALQIRLLDETGFELALNREEVVAKVIDFTLAQGNLLETGTYIVRIEPVATLPDDAVIGYDLTALIEDSGIDFDAGYLDAGQ